MNEVKLEEAEPHDALPLVSKQRLTSFSFFKSNSSKNLLVMMKQPNFKGRVIVLKDVEQKQKQSPPYKNIFKTTLKFSY